MSDILAYYEGGAETGRLEGPGALELLRTQDIARRWLPPPPAVVLDVGGGPGVYARWLAGLGYEAHLVDISPAHIEQARAAQSSGGRPIASAAVGDARSLEHRDGSADAILLLGPLYHITDRAGREAALRECRRVLRPGGVVLAAAISRFASLLDGLRTGALDDPAFAAIVADDLATGQHRNPARNPSWFTTAYFHRPEELDTEMRMAGLHPLALLGVEGPAWLLPDLAQRLADESRRARLLEMLEAVEAEPSLLGSGAHMLAIARRPH
jgi:ubiquinone/menaquinone biosynthesis C-methylase UbiE